MYLLSSKLPSRTNVTEVTALYRTVGCSIKSLFFKSLRRKVCYEEDEIEKSDVEIPACHLAPSPEVRSLLINWFWRRLREII